MVNRTKLSAFAELVVKHQACKAQTGAQKVRFSKSGNRERRRFLRLPHTGRLKTTNVYSVTALEAGSSKPGPCSLQRPSWPLLASGGCWQPLACSCIAPFLCLHLHVAFSLGLSLPRLSSEDLCLFFLFIGTSVIGLGPHFNLIVSVMIRFLNKVIF